MSLIVDGGSGGDSGIPSPESGVLADNEMVKANAGGAAIVGTGDTNSDTEVNFGSKDIITTGLMNSGTGTFRLGDAHDISSGGENVIFTNLVDNHHFSPSWVDNQTNESTSRFTVGAEQESSRETSKADVLINPSWISNPDDDLRIVKVTLEADTTITNVNASVKRDGKDFFSVKLGTLTANVETVIDLQNTIGNVPVDAFVGGNYEFSVSSSDGDVRLKGNLITGLPFFKIGFFDFIDDPVVQNRTDSTLGMNFVIDEDNMDSNSPTKVPTQQSVKKYVDDSVTAQLQYKGGYDADTNTPNLEVAPTGVITGYFYSVTVAGEFFATHVDVGDALIAEVDDPQVESDWTILNRQLDAATIKTLYESNADTNAFDDAAQSKLSGIESGAEVNNISDANASALTSGSETALHTHAPTGITVAQHRKMYGHEVHEDDTTSSNNYTVNDGAKTQIQNNAATQEKDLDPSIPHLIGTSGGAILDQVNALYSIGIQITGEPETRDKDYHLLFEIPDGVSPGVDKMISKRFQRFAKNLQEETISMSFVLACTSEIVNKEILPYIETDGTDLDYWATKLTVTKLNGPVIP